MKVIKAFRYHPDEKPHFLFHGNNGSTVVPLNKWVRAERRIVRDGSGKTFYASGFHAFTQKSALKEWQKSTKHKHVVATAHVRVTWEKSHSRHKGVVLAKWLYVSSAAWKNALKRWKDEMVQDQSQHLDQ